MAPGSYRVRVWCRNCGHKGWATILRGTPIEKVGCPQCGCTMLEKQP
jgi:ribosomal protein S27E